MDRSHVLDGKGVVEPCNDVLEESLRGCREDHVVHVQEQVLRLAIVVVDEERRVRARLNKAECGDMADESLEPRSWCLP